MAGLDRYSGYWLSADMVGGYIHHASEDAFIVYDKAFLFIYPIVCLFFLGILLFGFALLLRSSIKQDVKMKSLIVVMSVIVALISLPPLIFTVFDIPIWLGTGLNGFRCIPIIIWAIIAVVVIVLFALQPKFDETKIKGLIIAGSVCIGLSIIALIGVVGKPVDMTGYYDNLPSYDSFDNKIVPLEFVIGLPAIARYVLFLVVPLVLTVAIEMGIARFCFFKNFAKDERRRACGVVAAIQVITNISMNLIYLILVQYSMGWASTSIYSILGRDEIGSLFGYSNVYTSYDFLTALLIIAEIAVVIVEAIMYRKLLGLSKLDAVKMSIIGNAASCGIGYFVWRLMPYLLAGTVVGDAYPLGSGIDTEAAELPIAI